ncbi:UPF0149 family protein [Methylophaga lonarensis]|uniref:UPF0149 family protein n=1 Tax=Methylophaga lonarensis TaxID=999151 RepID=UPI003D290B8E
MSELYFPSLSPENMAGDGPSTQAELQGALCGLLCMNAKANRTDWFRQLFEDFHPGEDEINALTQLFDQTIQALNSPEYDFKLAFPEDSFPLASRLIAMADWCQGLIFGLGASGLTDETDLSADSQEYIVDVIKISQIADVDLSNADEDEANFEELTEYLRMGLFVLYSELQPEDPTQSITEH